MAGFPRGLLAEMRLGNEWTDITADIRQRTPITITRGRANETSIFAPSTCRFELDDQTGRYSPRNPHSPLYGLMGRNVAVRFSVHAITEDFEDANLAITVTNGGTAPWARSTGSAHTGGWSLRSGTITHGQTSDAIVTVPPWATTITFWYRTSSQTGFDVLRVIIGGVAVLAASGDDRPWTQASLDVSDATTVTFRYSKDSAVSTGDDAAYVDDVRFANTRYTGEIAKLTPRWDTTNGNRVVAADAAGVLRRLTQGASPLQSSLRRGLTLGAAPPVAYWPCEEGRHATVISSAVGGPAMTITGGPPRFGANTEFVCSVPLPTLGNSEWAGIVPGYPNPAGQTQVRFLLSIPDNGEPAANNGTVCRVRTSGTAAIWDITYGTAGGGTLTLTVSDPAGGLIQTSTTDFGMKGLPCRVGLTLAQNGPNIAWELQVGQIPDTVNEGNVSADTGTVTGRSVGVAQRVTIGLNRVFRETAVGHVSVQNQITDVFDLLNDLGAWAGETAVARFHRLCAQEGITARHIGTATTSARMGAQDPATLVDLLTECAQADLGELYEPTGAIGLVLRTRETLHNQTPAVALDYAAQQVGPPLDPVDDDQLTRNDILVKREEGSQVRVTQDIGPLSVSPPPAGVGRYDTSVTVNVHRDSQLGDIAGWLLRLGTVDEARYPKIRVDLRAPDITDTQGDAVMAVEIGDRVTITSLDAIDVFTGVSQLVRGYTETLTTAYAHSIVFNGSPESPWRVIALGDTVSRLDSDTSVLAAAVDADTVTLAVVTTPDGISRLSLWTTDPGEWPIPITIGGEDITVTAITGTSSPQTFTVTRSANGVHKPHPAGTPVQLTHQPAISF